MEGETEIAACCLDALIVGLSGSQGGALGLEGASGYRNLGTTEDDSKQKDVG